MIFTRVIPALLVAAAAAQALYIPDVLDAREFEESDGIAARSIGSNDVIVLTARDFAQLGLRSEDVLSQMLVTRNPPPEGPYQCQNKADCQTHVVHAQYQMGQAQNKINHWQGQMRVHPKGSAEHRNAKNNLHTARESKGGWEEHRDFYENHKSNFANRR